MSRKEAAIQIFQAMQTQHLTFRHLAKAIGIGENMDKYYNLSMHHILTMELVYTHAYKKNV